MPSHRGRSEFRRAWRQQSRDPYWRVALYCTPLALLTVPFWALRAVLSAAWWLPLCALDYLTAGPGPRRPWEKRRWPW